ncbi:unnamed protein product [Musa textilis]
MDLERSVMAHGKAAPPSCRPPSAPVEPGVGGGLLVGMLASFLRKCC